MKRLLLTLLLLTAASWAQVQLPPIATAAADPATCSTNPGIGELAIYYNTATPGFKYCSAANTWTAFGAAQAAPFTTSTANPAQSGVLRCANNETCVAGRDSTNATDLTFKFDSSNLANFSVGLTAPSYASGTANGGFSGTEGTGANAGTAGAGTDLLYPQSTVHDWVKNSNNAGAQVVVGTSTTASTVGNCVQYATGGYNIADSGATCGSTPSPATQLVRDEFIGGNTTSGTVGEAGWSSVTTIGHLGTIGATIGAFPNLGQLKLTTAATAQGDGLNIYLSNSQPPSGDLSAHAGWTVYGVAQTTSTANVRERFGFGDTVTGCQAANDIVVRFDTNASFADTNYTFETGAASVYTASASATAATTGFHTFKITSAVAGEITFSVDGGATTCFTAAASGGCTGAGTAVHSAHIPTASMTPNFTICTDTAGGKVMNIDYFSWYYTGMGR